jgi:hypothetical protein
MTTLQSKITHPKDTLFHELAGEGVLLNLETGKYYGLDEVGTRMWMLLVEQGSLETVYRILLEEYDVDAFRLEHDLIELADKLAEQGLIRLCD